ncbi:MAG: homoserine O-acetyltransferase [Pseudolabrys sp.]|nr:homoserine O-acetyltransferase [Pseudolabrys sp.]
MLRGLSLVRLVCALVLVLPIAAFAQDDLIVEKKTFSMPSYTTVAGATIKDVKIGWESAGTLNADKSNAILIAHFFSGTSHAFGKYAKDDKAAGYWDYLVGPGKVVDTNKYFVLSSDTLVNLNVNAPNVVTTGPASINPDTGKPYGMSFPVVSIKDFVRVQKALVDSLGIKKLHAVMGASMGALQTYEWAASFPEAVDRIVPVIGTPGGDAFLIEWLNIWAAPIKLDPNWNGGNYYGGKPPTEGLKEALKIVTLQANHSDWAIKTFGNAPADPAKDPAAAMDNKFKIEAAIDAAAAARAATSDANSLIYLAKANQLANADPAKIKAPALILYSPTDLVFYAPLVEEAAKKIAAGGTAVDTGQLPGPNGHLNGVLAVAQQGERIKAFLAK